MLTKAVTIGASNAEDIYYYYVMGLPRVGNDNEGFISNAGFVVTDEGVVVFDALGTPSLAQALVAKIREKTDQPIKRVVVSHCFRPWVDDWAQSYGRARLERWHRALTSHRAS